MEYVCGLPKAFSLLETCPPNPLPLSACLHPPASCPCSGPSSLQLPVDMVPRSGGLWRRFRVPQGRLNRRHWADGSPPSNPNCPLICSPHLHTNTPLTSLVTLGKLLLDPVSSPRKGSHMDLLDKIVGKNPMRCHMSATWHGTWPMIGIQETLALHTVIIITS